MKLQMLSEWGHSTDRMKAQRGFRPTHTPLRSNRGANALAIVALVSSLTFLGLASYLLSQQHVPQAGIQSTPIIPSPIEEIADVLIPIRSISKGDPLLPTLFTRARRPKAGLPATAVAKFSDIQGKFARSDIPAHYPFLHEWMTEQRPMNQLALSIPKGFRAVTIEVSATTGVEGWARAGATVDVHWVSDLLGERSVKLLVENARILSAERKLDPDADPDDPLPTTVTLLAGEKDAQKISLGATSGELVLHLRGFDESGRGSKAHGTLTVNDLLGKNDGHVSDTQLEGYVRMRDDDGNLTEYAVMDGKLHKRKQYITEYR